MSVRKFRGRKKLFNKNKEEIKELQNNNKIIYNGDVETVKRAGFEGDAHLSKKIEVAISLVDKYKNSFCSEVDGIYMEYPLRDPANNLSLYNQKKLKYLLSIYQDINGVKNLGNIFNPNLRSTYRSKKCLKSLNIIKILDICVVIGGVEVEAVEIKITNGMTKKIKNYIESLYPNLVKEI